jgi:hypothetical protein
MAITFDIAASDQGTSGTVETVSITIANNANRFLFVGVGLSASTPGTVSGITFNGSPLTPIWEVFNGGNHRCEGWYIKAPDAGTHDIQVTFSGAADEWAIGGVSLYGVDQTTPIGTPAEASDDASSTATVNVGSADGELVVDCVYGLATAIAAGANQDTRWEEENIGGNSGGSSTEPGQTTVTMSWTTFSDEWAIGAVSVKPAAAGAAAEEFGFGPIPPAGPIFSYRKRTIGV